MTTLFIIIICKGYNLVIKALIFSMAMEGNGNVKGGSLVPDSFLIGSTSHVEATHSQNYAHQIWNEIS